MSMVTENVRPGDKVDLDLLDSGVVRDVKRSIFYTLVTVRVETGHSAHVNKLAWVVFVNGRRRTMYP